MKHVLLIIFLLILAVVGSVVTRLNSAPINFNYYFGSLEIPLALLLMLTLGCGSLLGLSMTLSMALSARAEKRRLQRTLQLREQEIRNLRDIPIKGRH
jgi:putative membrane protein